MQRVEEVELALARYVRDEILNGGHLQALREAVAAAVSAKRRKKPASTDKIEQQIDSLRADQKRLAKRLAKPDDAPELEEEYKERGSQIRRLEAVLAEVKQAASIPDEAKSLDDTIAAEVARMSESLTSHGKSARAVYQRLFPDGLVFHPEPFKRNGRDRYIWRITGVADLSSTCRSGQQRNGRFSPVRYTCSR
jgi:hypothetical protein